jgi:hypothetical protein
MDGGRFGSIVRGSRSDAVQRRGAARLPEVGRAPDYWPQRLGWLLYQCATYAGVDRV